MNTSITSVRENPLLERREVEVEVEHEDDPTPSKEDIRDRIAAENNLDTDKIEVESIYTGFGKNRSRASLKVYEEFEYDEELERKPEEEQTTEQQETEDASTGSDDTDYDEVVSGTITEAKEALGDMDEPDYEAALEAEKDNKDRKTLKEWLESRIEG